MNELREILTGWFKKDTQLDQAISDIKQLLKDKLPKEKKTLSGKDCKCAAYGENECGCGADWTDYTTYNQYRQEVLEIIEKL